jgi:hypothetical protein
LDSRFAAFAAPLAQSWTIIVKFLAAFLPHAIISCIFVTMLDWLKSPKLLERAENAAKQMRYFRLFSQRGIFGELSASAKRAGFELIHEDAFDKEASFRWAADRERPDLLFYVSFGNLESVQVVAESYGDVYGLVLLSHSNLPKISVEVKPSLESEFGRNAHSFQKILLTFPDFDGGVEGLFSI